VSTDSEAPKPSRAPSASACEPYRELIELGLGRGRNAMAIWQDLVDEHGFSAKYASVKRYVAKLRGVHVPEARNVIVTAPGEEAQVDYGTGPMVRHPATGKYRRTRLFVMTLGHSRKSVRLLVWKSGAKIWAELHECAFQRLGGAVRVVVLDNLREGVLTPDVYDAALNPLYRDVLAHYGACALPCRVRDPDRSRATAEALRPGRGHRLWTAVAQRVPMSVLAKGAVFYPCARILACASGMTSVRFTSAGGIIVAPRFGSYVEPSRQIANRMPAIFRASATIAIRLPRRFSISCAQRTIGSFGRQRRATQQAWTSTHRILADPALVIAVVRFRSPLECSPGTRPRYDSSCRALAKRSTSSSVAANLIAVTGPTPGTVIRRWHV
jgi:transposase